MQWGLTMKKKISLLMIALFLLGAATTAAGETKAPPALEKAQRQVTVEFARLDEKLKQAATILGATGLTGNEARQALLNLCNDFDYAVDCAAVDLQGKMVTLEPAPFRQFEGKDISDQEQIKRILKTGQPVLSNVFRSVEGFPAADAEYPVATPQGQRIGSVSILFHPEKMLARSLVPLLQGTSVDIWAMEKSGLILYDRDSTQIGLNLFTSSLYQPYTSLVRLGRQIAAKPAGKGSYQFLSGSSPQVVRKKAFWRTASQYGTEWRLVAIYIF